MKKSLGVRKQEAKARKRVKGHIDKVISQVVDKNQRHLLRDIRQRS